MHFTWNISRSDWWTRCSTGEVGLPWIVSLLMEPGLCIYIQSSEGVGSPILMDIILSETGLYLPWRVPHLPSSIMTRMHCIPSHLPPCLHLIFLIIYQGSSPCENCRNVKGLRSSWSRYWILLTRFIDKRTLHYQNNLLDFITDRCTICL